MKELEDFRSRARAAAAAATATNGHHANGEAAANGGGGGVADGAEKEGELMQRAAAGLKALIGALQAPGKAD